MFYQLMSLQILNKEKNVRTHILKRNARIFAMYESK